MEHLYYGIVAGLNGVANSLTSLELFAGAGGLALGVKNAGFRHLDIIELDARACMTLDANRHSLGIPIGHPVVPTDVTGFDYGPFRDRVDLLAGGVPCQPFSLGGKHRGHADHRNLFPETFRAVREVRPAAVIVENVRGLLRESFRPYFHYILEQLARPERLPDRDEAWQHHHTRLRGPLFSDELTYSVTYQRVNCADFGVPQQRERVFVVAFRSDLGTVWEGVSPTHSKDALLWALWIDGSYWDEHELPVPAMPSELQPQVQAVSNGGEPSAARWRTVRDAIGSLPPALTDADHPTVLNHRINPGARPYKGHTGSPLDWPSKALKAGDHGVPGGENTVQLPDGSLRYYTVREAARIQTFPDEYHFLGPWSEAMRQIGNAVPVSMAQLVAESVRAQLVDRGRVTDFALARVRELRVGYASA